MKNKLLTILFGVAVFFFIITFSIGLPIYARFFYYLQINALGIPEKTGYSYAEIKAAYDEVLNFLTLPNREFGTGVFSYTPQGMAHFEDCKVLFNLNLIVLICSSAIIALCLILNKFKVFSFCRPFGMNVSFISAVSIFAVIAVLAIIIAIDFNAAFVAFHHLFFPGKDNWQFSSKDEIIYALPQQFFMNCAILIGASIIIICVAIIVFQLVKKHKNAKKDDINEQN